MIEEALLQRVLTVATRYGADFAEVFVEDRRSTAAVLDDGRVEDLTSGRDRGAGIRVVVGDSTGFAHTADLSEAGLLATAQIAAEAARASGEGRGVGDFKRDAVGRPSRVERLPSEGANAPHV